MMVLYNAWMIHLDITMYGMEFIDLQTKLMLINLKVYELTELRKTQGINLSSSIYRPDSPDRETNR